MNLSLKIKSKFLFAKKKHYIIGEIEIDSIDPQ